MERFAPEGGEILAAAVVTEEGNYDYALPATTDMIWDFMGQFYRYGGGVLSNAISWKVDYEEMGVEFRSFTDSQGIDRQYLVYIPGGLPRQRRAAARGHRLSRSLHLYAQFL